MSIIRTKHTKENPFVLLDKRALWDQNLSLAAIGLWARLLSRPDDWKVYVSELCKSCGCGKDKIYNILNELIANGYAYRRQIKNKVGEYKGFEYIIFESKTSEEEIQKMLPQRDFPDTGKPDTEKPPLLNNYPKPNNEKEKEEASPLSAFSVFDSGKKREVASLVFVHEKEEEIILDKLGGDRTKLQRCYDLLSSWKISKPKYRPDSDYLAIFKWVIEAIEEGFPTIDTSKLIHVLEREFPKLLGKAIIIGHNYIEFPHIPEAHFKFRECAFLDKVINSLRKMNLPVSNILEKMQKTL